MINENSTAFFLSITNGQKGTAMPHSGTDFQKTRDGMLQLISGHSGQTRIVQEKENSSMKGTVPHATA
jgi:hypothetical protein